MTTPIKYPNITTIGVTGTIGSGKSTIGKILQELGVVVIDSDKIVHRLLESDDLVKAEVIKRFGSTILATASDGVQTIDRPALGNIVFNNAEAKTDLERILHPRVREDCRAQIAKLAEEAKTKIVAYLVPLLFESGLGKEYDQTWAVITDESVLRARLAKRDGFSFEVISKRLALQLSQTMKAALADETIDNSHDLENTRDQVVSLLKKLNEPSRGGANAEHLK